MRKQHALPAIVIATSFEMLLIAGCSSSGWNPTSGLEDVPETVTADERPLAIIAGEPVYHTEMIPILGEILGTDALREIALDRQLSRELERQGLTISQSDIENERARLAAALGPDETGQQLLRQVLESRSLGPHRLGTLLKRNAGLRKLVETPEPPNDDAIRVAYEIRHGAKREIRIVLLGSSREAARARDEIIRRADDVGMSAAVAEIARDRSIDPTASVGGSLGAISTADPGLPAMLRRAVAASPVDAIGDIVALDAGFALVLVERDIAPDGTDFESVREDLAAEISERAMRLEMESLAEELITRAAITPIHPALRWSWDRSSADQ